VSWSDKPAPNKKLKVPRELINPDKAFPNEAIRESRDLMPAVDGLPPLTIGPYTPRDATACEIDPVRIAGSRIPGQHKPTAHAKLLVLGEVGAENFGPDFWPDYDVECRFTPRSSDGSGRNRIIPGRFRVIGVE
jgi:hypothetical protein